MSDEKLLSKFDGRLVTESFGFVIKKLQEKDAEDEIARIEGVKNRSYEILPLEDWESSMDVIKSALTAYQGYGTDDETARKISHELKKAIYQDREDGLYDKYFR